MADSQADPNSRLEHQDFHGDEAAHVMVKKVGMTEAVPMWRLAEMEKQGLLPGAAPDLSPEDAAEMDKQMYEDVTRSGKPNPQT